MIFHQKRYLLFLLVAAWLGSLLLSGCRAGTPEGIIPAGRQETTQIPIANSDIACAQPAADIRFAPLDGKNKIAFSAEHLSLYDVDADQVLSFPELPFAEHTTSWGFVWGPDAESLVFINGRAQPYPANPGCLYLAHLSTGALTLLDKTPRVFRGLDWSPTCTPAYIRHQLQVTGFKGPSLFVEDAMQRIYDYTKGIPHQINRVCSIALPAGMIDQKTTLDESTLRKVIGDQEMNG